MTLEQGARCILSVFSASALFIMLCLMGMTLIGLNSKHAIDEDVAIARDIFVRTSIVAGIALTVFLFVWVR